MRHDQLVRSAVESNLDLLRAFEPIVRYTHGELFFPMRVDPYVGHCSLWRGEAGGDATCVISAGGLSLDRLCEAAVVHQGHPLSLRFVRAPLGRAAYRRWRRAPRARLRATARFTTTGIFGRLVDAGFRASLLLRGSVAAGLAAAAEVAYREHGEPERFRYYGRVVRDGGYLCLQYWLFYAMNDWRSTFGGVNDHEADWELVTIYLSDQGAAPPRPAWVAVSAHDHTGDDLRRRWDDPELLRHGNHPVVFAGAGSHAATFVPGDYVISVDPPQLRKLIALARSVQRLVAPWREETRAAPGFGIPFVEYARGDGRCVGPGQAAGWAPTLIDDETPWVRAYRGLWGLDTKDRFGGERAPAGPRYERDGSLRYAWVDPLGWAGLHKVSACDEEASDLLTERVHALERELSELNQTIANERGALRGLQSQLRSLDAHDYARALAATRRAALIEGEAALNEHIAERARLSDERRTHIDTLRRPPPAQPAQAHLTRAPGPRSEEQQRRTRFLRLWAVVSTPLLIASPIVVLVARPLAYLTTIAALIALFLGMEAFARQRFISLVASVLLVLAVSGLVVGVILLFRQHWREAVSVMLGAAALSLLVGNVGDLRYGWRKGAKLHDDGETEREKQSHSI